MRHLHRLLKVVAICIAITVAVGGFICTPSAVAFYDICACYSDEWGTLVCWEDTIGDNWCRGPNQCTRCIIM